MEPGASPLPRPKPRPPEPLPPRTPGGSLRNLEHENADGRFNMPPPSHPIYRRMILSSSLPESPRIDRGAIAKLQHQAARRRLESQRAVGARVNISALRERSVRGHLRWVE